MPPSFAMHVMESSYVLLFVVVVFTPVGRTVICDSLTVICDSFYPNCKIQIGDYVLNARLIVLKMSGFDMILGMD